MKVSTHHCVFCAVDVSGCGLTGVYRAVGDQLVFKNQANDARIQWRSTSSEGRVMVMEIVKVKVKSVDMKGLMWWWCCVIILFSKGVTMWHG